MPNAKISERSHRTAKDSDRAIIDEVDRWLDCAEVFDAMFIVDQQTDVLHKPTVTPHGHLEAECHAPNDGVWVAVGPAQAEALVQEHDGEQCPHCLGGGE